MTGWILAAAAVAQAIALIWLAVVMWRECRRLERLLDRNRSPSPPPHAGAFRFLHAPQGTPTMTTLRP